MTAAIAGRSPRARGALVRRARRVLVAGVELFPVHLLKSELAPTEDRGTIVGIGIAPEGSTIEYTDHYASDGSRAATSRSRRSSSFRGRASQWSARRSRSSGSRTGRSASASSRRSPPRSGPRCSASRASGVPGQSALARAEPGRQAGQFVIQTSLPYDELQKMVDALIAEARDYPACQPRHRPQAQQARARGRPRPRQGRQHRRRGRHRRPHARDHAGRPPGDRFKRDGKQYDVIVQVADVDRRNPDDLATIYVRRRRRDGQLTNLVKRDRDASRPRSSTTSTSCARPRSPRPSRRATRWATR